MGEILKEIQRFSFPTIIENEFSTNQLTPLSIEPRGIWELQ